MFYLSRYNKTEPTTYTGPALMASLGDSPERQGLAHNSCLESAYSGSLTESRSYIGLHADNYEENNLYGS